MGYGNKILLDVYTIGKRNKVCNLYDSDGQQFGSAYNIKRTREMNGWKELSFTLPVTIDKKINWRAQFMTNEYELRVIDGGEVDWYRITEPTDSDDGIKAEIKVVCPHASALLKKRNLYLEFTDENGIGTLQQLATIALNGSGCVLGHCDTFYEPGTQTEKVRTYNCSTKTGTYQMIQDLCDKFYAYPVYYFDDGVLKVDLLARARHDGLLEMRLDKNLSKISRKRDSSDIITRLYVEGEYGDLGYVGIDDIDTIYKPAGLNCLIDFSYYDEIGALTNEQRQAIEDYKTNVGALRQQITAAAGGVQSQITALQRDWGTQGYIIYPVVNGTYSTPIYGNGATEADAMVAGDGGESSTARVASVQQTTGTVTTYEYITVSNPPTPRTNEIYAVKFVLPCGGVLGGKEVAVEAKRETISTLTAERTEYDPGTQEYNSLTEQITTEETNLATLLSESYVLMLDCIGRATTIGSGEASLSDLMEDLSDEEDAFIAVMGDLLQDGYYSDNTYAPGQEQALYNDSVEMMAVLCRPQHTYVLNEKDIANVEGYTDEIYTMNMAVHFYEKTQGINDYGFVEQIDEYLDRANSREVDIKTDELNIQGKSFASFLNRITDAAQVVKDKQSVYDRAKALSGDGTLGTNKLNGIIDVLKNQLVASKSNWYTDENGNILFVSADESSAMMLCGTGFMVANGKDQQGNWNWRTFGTGDGFTADLITAGVLRASVITILGSERFYWNEDNIYIIDPSDGNKQIRIGRYDTDNNQMGIGYTTDGGLSWQNAIDFNGIHLSAGDQAKIDNAGRGGHNYIPDSISIPITGSCGANLKWTLNSIGILDITGTGAMTDFAYDGMPWYSNHANYSTLNLPIGLTHIGTWAFEFAWGLTSVIIPNTVESIGDRAFHDCHNMEYITVPSSVTTIGSDVFTQCDILTIRCVEGSAADTYAQANNIPVEYM